MKNVKKKNIMCRGSPEGEASKEGVLLVTFDQRLLPQKGEETDFQHVVN